MSDKSLQQNNGGQYSAAIAAGANGAVSVLTGAGRLSRVIIMSAGSAATDIYDSTAASGTKIFTIAANPTIGTVYDVQIPVSTGIFVGGASNTSALTVTYNKDGVNGN